MKTITRNPGSQIFVMSAAWICIVPFLWIIHASFLTTPDIDSGRIWPSAGLSGFTLENYLQIFQKMEGFPHYYANSMFLAVGGTFLVLVLGSMAAYGLAGFRFPGQQAIFLTFLLTIMVPGEVILMGQFHLLVEAGLFNTRTGLLLSGVALNLVMTIFLMRNIFSAIPKDLVDAARIDGAGHWTIFWEIYIPFGATGLSACAILSFLNIWNEFTFALTLTTSETTMTLPVGVTLLQGQSLHDTGALFASVMLSFLPIITVFIILQKYFVRGLMQGAIKE